MVILIPIMRRWNLEMASTRVLIYSVVLKHDVVGGILGDFTFRNVTADPLLYDQILKTAVFH